MPSGDNFVAVDIQPLRLPDVPDLPARTGRSWWMAALPAVGCLGAVGFLAFAPRSPFIYVAVALMVLVSIGMVVGNLLSAKNERRDTRRDVRERFLDQLDDVRAQLRARADRVRVEHSAATLTPAGLQVPIAAMSVTPPTDPVVAGQRADPFCRDRLRQFIERTAVIDDVPLGHVLASHTVIAGPAQQARGFARHLLSAIVREMAPESIRVAVLSAEPHRWRALRWAPQHRHPTDRDASGPARLVGDNASDLVALLRTVRTPVLLLVDGAYAIPDVLRAHVTWTLVLDSGNDDADLVISERGSLICKGSQDHPRALRCSAAELEATCRAAARDAGHGRYGPQADAVDEPMRPILGATEHGVLHLDLRETGRGGTGPHGMLIGATGSGKSEVLRSIVAGLVSVHPPAELALLLVDFKGGATFAPFEELPQTAAVITNLEEDPSMISRVRMALAAELRRRQRIVKDAAVASVEELPSSRTPPRLLVVVDEFSELLNAQPETLDVLVQIGRLGRSLGVHLLIAAQRLDEGRIKGLESHLTYRIALRTQSAAESRAVIGTSDAALLPNAPGRGYLRRGSSAPVEFRARFTAAQDRNTSEERYSANPPRPALLRYPNGPLISTDHVVETRSVLDAAIASAATKPGQRLPIWVPPPQRSPTHQELYGDLSSRVGRGYGTETGTSCSATIGLVDRPDLQRIERAAINLQAGHLAIVGTTRSGRSTAAQSTVLSMALRNTPSELNLYLIESAVGELSVLRTLPHTAGYAAEAARTRAVLRRVVTLIDEREQQRGSEPGGASNAPMNARTSAPTIVLAIDGYARSRDAQEQLDPVLLDIAQRGLAVDVHVVLTAHRWLDLRARMRELFGNRIELRIGDPIESEIDRRAAALVPRARPGRGLTQDGHPLYVAKSDAAAIAARIDREWTGPRAAALAELPPVLTVGNLSPELLDRGLCLAVEQSAGRAVVLPAHPPFCLVIGDQGTGRTSVLRSLARQDARRGSALLVIDPRRGMLGDLPDERLLGYAATPAAATELVRGLVEGLERRMPPADITAEQLRERSWWDGPQLHLIVDDYDILTLIGTSLAPLRRFLPYAADIGLRVSLARNAAGAAAALHDETLSALRDLAASALLLSRAIDEGPLLGARPGLAPWGSGLLVARGQPAIDVQAITEPPHATSAAQAGSLGRQGG